jgi:UDP-N-acetylmuramoyl-tripeptide--D-alanyl-D-alanine ligase
MSQAALMTLGEAMAMLPGARLLGDPATPIGRVHSDTRSLRPGDCFVALRGERFDGADCLPQARQAGAVAALVSTQGEARLMASGLPGLVVPDALKALGTWSAAWRGGFQGPLIGVTGSNGKTTVTQMVASVLRAAFGNAAWATQGNFNNEIGVPLTLLGLRPHAGGHQAAVVELGMNHPGEIAHLCSLAQPTIGLVNNAQREHQEFMASVQAVAEENGEVIRALPAHGVAVFPADDAFSPLWQQWAGARRCVRFALEGPAEITAQARWGVQGARAAWRGRVFTPSGEFELDVASAGVHNLKNALAATACAWAAACPLNAIEAGLKAFEPVKGRSALLTLRRQGRELSLIDDSYNANPDSVRAAIEVLATLPLPRWLLLGDMGEVGEHGERFHEEVGRFAAEQGVSTLWAVGPASTAAARAFEAQASRRGQGQACRHFALTEHAREACLGLANWPEAASMLVKGSRFMKMDTLVSALFEAAAQEGECGAD